MSLPRIRVHVDGSIGVARRDGTWLVISASGFIRGHDTDKQVHEPGWSEAAVVELAAPDVEGEAAGMRGARWGKVRAVAWSDGSEPCVRQSQLPGQLTADEAEVLAGRFLAAARWLRGLSGDAR